jgi:hypothetical protein
MFIAHQQPDWRHDALFHRAYDYAMQRLTTRVRVAAGYDAMSLRDVRDFYVTHLLGA